MPRASKWNAQHARCQAAVDAVKADLGAEIERLKGELEKLENILSPEALRGDQTIDDAYDIVFRALASLEERPS